MSKSVNGIILAVAAVLFVPILSHAAGLGNLTVHSKLGHPLVAEIEVLSFRPGEENSFQVRLAAREAFRDAGVEFNPALASARLTLEKRAGKTVIRITTTQPVNDPFLNVLVEMQWPNGRLAREYTVLVDPVEYKSAAMAASELPAAQAAAVTPVPAPTRTETVAAAPQPVPAPVVTTTPREAPLLEPRVAGDQSPAPPVSVSPVAVPAAAPTVAPATVVAPTAAPTAAATIAASTAAAPAETPAARPAPAQGAILASTPVAAPIAQAAPERRDSSPQTASAVSAPVPVSSPAQPVTERTVVASAPAGTPAMTASPASPSKAQTAAPSAASVAPAPRAPVAREEVSEPAKQRVAAPSPVRPERPVADAKPVVAKRTAVPAPGPREAAETYTIRRGDTLGAIARRNRLDGVTYNQMLMALFRGNPDVFIRDNINLIRAGARIAIPTREVAVAINARQAYRDVIAHMADFASYRRQLSATGVTTSKVRASAQREAISRREVTRKSARTM